MESFNQGGYVRSDMWRSWERKWKLPTKFFS